MIKELSPSHFSSDDDRAVYSHNDDGGGTIEEYTQANVSVGETPRASVLWALVPAQLIVLMGYQDLRLLPVAM
ncbi:hypothetical protein E2C01_028770 [Portunus trituberculatus]|uniref:Uncharacterized protein n=1 Tax=Portunus trituberculatus TaxID=210409 RepID=A0A5B7EPX9_PORTR|nr:hypothetical protein [Portunus trituberculatus]